MFGSPFLKGEIYLCFLGIFNLVNILALNISKCEGKKKVNPCDISAYKSLIKPQAFVLLQSDGGLPSVICKQYLNFKNLFFLSPVKMELPCAVYKSGMYFCPKIKVVCLEH